MSRSPEYYQYIQSENWRKKSNFFKKLFFGRCVLFPWLKAKHSHHLTYDNFQNEKFWFDCLPLSESGHSLIHLPFLWKLRPVRFLVNLYLRTAAIALLPIVIIGLTSFYVGDLLCLTVCPGLYIGNKKKYKSVLKAKQHKRLKAAKR